MSALAAIVIADDLTGSLDSIAPFVRAGVTCVAAVSTGALAAAVALAPDVLAVNLGTREASPEVARERAAAATRALMPAAAPDTIWIKKIDSRLKGPVAAEISAMCAALHPRRVLVCPAIPELGRVVAHGHLRGHGVGLGLHVAKTVALDLGPGLPLDFPDATSDAELDDQAAAAAPGTLFAGARGLASALARRRFPACPPAPAAMPCGPVGFAVGSRDPVTLAQVAQLCAQGGPALIPAPDGEVTAGAISGSFVIQATAGCGAAAEVVSFRLAEGVVRHAIPLKSLVLTGGETAAAVLDAAGIRLLRVEGEILPGLPVCRAVDVPGFPAVITKSGGFGPPDTLLRLWQAAQNPEGCS